jgi:hypothetical protein
MVGEGLTRVGGLGVGAIAIATAVLVLADMRARRKTADHNRPGRLSGRSIKLYYAGNAGR